jgi:hypothetical protein
MTVRDDSLDREITPREVYFNRRTVMRGGVVAAEAGIPAAVIDPDTQPLGLCDSRWSFDVQCRRLIASRNYDTDGSGDDR